MGDTLMQIAARNFKPLTALVLSMLLSACGGGGGGDDSSSAGSTTGWSIPQNQVVDGGPGQDGIPSIDNPKYISARRVDWLADDELVVGVQIGGSVLMFAHQILNWHEVVNSTNNLDDWVLSYCPLTGTAIAWDVDDSLVDTEFGVSGLLYNSNLIMYDRQTGSHWSQMLERGVRGERDNEQAEPIQAIETTWGTWRTMYPDSLVMSRDTGFGRDYFTYPYGTYRSDDRLLFPVSNQDNRLHPKERVIGIRSDDSSRVFQIASFPSGTQALNEQFLDEAIVVVGDATRNFAAIYNRELDDGTILSFTPLQDQLPLVMTDTEGNNWDVFGEAISGPRTGTRLKRTRSYIAMWFAWAAFFEDPEIHFN
jgi:hypothetical protein